MPHSSIGRPFGRPFELGAGHRQPGVGHAPAEVGRTLAVVHVAVDALPVDHLHVHGEELRDVLVGRPVDRHPQLVAVALLELLLQLRALEPVVAEPVQVGELLVGELPELAVGPGGERPADEVVDVEGRQRDVLAFARHPVGQVDRRLQARVRPDQIRVVDVGVVQVAVGLHLRLHRLHDLPLAEHLVIHLDAGDLLERLGQHLRLVLVRRDRLRQDVDLHALVGLGGIDEPLHLLQLLLFGQRGRLELLFDPLLRLVHAGLTGGGEDRCDGEDERCSELSLLCHCLLCHCCLLQGGRRFHPISR